ncbi:carboxylesterase family protein [Draconibacterium sp. IB214405]|uniref:carboxylesterase/lipase family protein n=1 Tax=Draconibacterium sp. IB214405 TaxID=3097352 RepID=UPI002A11A894|nr:carboxylesterase family protein [Draconibacterium sp. IB214405]MDX8339774.1 carboxylesterase family protein [Draconibacterium sp. IB214405]
MKRIVFFLFIFAAFISAGQSGVGPTVKVKNGSLQGINTSGIGIFKGIPFAEPPVGELRWKEPQPVKNWEGILDATKFGPCPMQAKVYGDMFFRADTMSEDCLYLNVWTPAKTYEEKLPVLVYFYGGGYRAGDGSEPRYDGESMARNGIVSVTVNYRLGVFGFLAHPGLSAENDYKGSGNYALMDQYAALKWVQENIAAFGGDPNRVTIAGESCGSRSVCAQMASPLSKGLIAGAIGESGALMNSTLVPSSLKKAEETGLQFQKLADAGSIAELRAIPEQELLEISGKPGAPYFVPNVDNYFLPDFPLAIFENGEQADVPFLVGWNSEEMNFRFIFGMKEPTLENFKEVLEGLYGDRAEEAFELYHPESDADVEQIATDLAGDRFAGFNSWKWMELHHNTASSPLYRYFYSRPRPAMRAEMGNAQAGFAGGITRNAEVVVEKKRKTGAVHSAEIEYALGNLPTNRVYDWQPEDYKVSEIVQGFFINFIKTGNPNGFGVPYWPSTEKDMNVQMHIDVESKAEIDPSAKRYEWLNQLPDELVGIE